MLMSAVNNRWSVIQVMVRNHHDHHDHHEHNYQIGQNDRNDEQLACLPRNDATLRGRRRDALHCERLTAAGLTVSEYCAIVALGDTLFQ